MSATHNSTSVGAGRRCAPLAAIVCVTCVFVLSANEALADVVPPGWTAADVGAVGIAGSTTYSNGEFIVNGAGQDIWNKSDGMFFVYHPLGDGEIVARVLSEENTNVYAKAGLDFRQTIAATSSHVILDVKPDGSIEFMTRVVDNATTTFIAGATASFPVWLKLTHSGGTITGWISNDNQSWTMVGSTWFQDPTAYAGLVVTSHDTAVVNSAAFDNVMVDALEPGPLPGWSVQDVGDTGATGTASYSNGTFIVSGDGGDIWGNADSFTFAYLAVWNQLATLEARVTGMQNTNAYAKAGLIVRSSLDPASPSVILDVKPDGGVEFMSRLQEGGPTSFIAGAVVDPSKAVRLRLVVDSANRVTGLISEGTTWTPVGVTTMPSVDFAGLAVTSHSPGVLNTSTFDQVVWSTIWDY